MAAHGARSPFRVSLVAVVAGLTVLFAATLAYEAHQATRTQQRTAERALREYAGLAVSAFRERFHETWRAEARRALAPATLGFATSPFDPLVSLDVLREAAGDTFVCGTVQTTRAFLRLDLRTGVVVVDPVTLPGSTIERLTEAARQATARLPSPNDPYRLIPLHLDGGAEWLVAGVRFVRPGAPIAVYAFTVCPGALAALATRVYRAAPLLSASIAADADNDRILALDIRDADRVLAAFREDDRSQFAATTPLDDIGLTATAALRSSALGVLSVGSPVSSRVPLLIGLLALTLALGAVAVFQLRREHELAQMRVDFTSSVSHELRTPLTQILLYGETLLLDRARTDADRQLAKETIVSEARRLMHMVDNVLAFGRVQRAPQSTELKPVPVAAVVAEAVHVMRPVAAAAGVEIAEHVAAATDYCVAADRLMLRQVLLNLLDNGIKHAGERGQVRVECAPADGVVRLAVSDSGHGVPISQRERVFLPFVRLAPDGERAGTGLGLAVVRELILRMNGRVWIEDSPLGGARFSIELGRMLAGTAVPTT